MNIPVSSVDLTGLDGPSLMFNASYFENKPKEEEKEEHSPYPTRNTGLFTSSPVPLIKLDSYVKKLEF